MKSSELLRILKADGWFVVRQTGSHIIMRHSVKENQVSVPFHAGKEVKKGTLQSILKDAELKITKR